MSVTQAARYFLDRIEAIDRRGPRLGSMIELNPDAMRIAAAPDTERREGKRRGLFRDSGRKQRRTRHKASP